MFLSQEAIHGVETSLVCALDAKDGWLIKRHSRSPISRVDMLAD